MLAKRTAEVWRLLQNRQAVSPDCHRNPSGSSSFDQTPYPTITRPCALENADALQFDDGIDQQESLGKKDQAPNKPADPLEKLLLGTSDGISSENPTSATGAIQLYGTPGVPR